MGKITRKDIRHDLGEDIVLEKGAKLWQWVKDHQNLITAVIAAGVFIWIAVILFGRLRNNAISEANFNLLRAQSSFLQGLDTLDEKVKKTLMDDCEQKLSEVAKKFSGSPVGRRALFMSGVFQFRQMNFTAARKNFEQFAKQASGSEDRARGAIAQGVCYENESFMKSDPALVDKALACYREGGQLGGDNYVKYQAMMDKARILARKIETRPEAVKLLEAVIKGREEVMKIANPKPKEKREANKPDLQELENLDGLTMIKEAQETLERLKGTLSAETAPAQGKDAKPSK
ncbi:MAG: hypothetical protein NTX50_17425 [Candidatus Sumerlaeota bacterium]|nr:hypothetical protein [Candidatus Sumerlaeota bacterium]